MALERKILTIVKPTILLDEMNMMDTTNTNAPLVSQSIKHNQSGSIYPLVQIGNYQFTENELVSMRLEEMSFLPTIQFTLAITDGVFLSKNYPKDGDPFSLFIRSKTDEFKPIRADFVITSVNSAPSTDETGDVNLFNIEGVLRVPGLFAEQCKSFSDMTSFDALIEVSKDLKIGFASNETDTKDKMNWICPFDTIDTFIKDVTFSTYKNDDSFFQSFIDKYYYLNLVNVNNQFSEEFEIETAQEILTMSEDYFKGREVQKFETNIFLSNHHHLKGSGNFIQAYTLLNNSGQVVIDNGYRRYLQFYDSFFTSNLPADKYQSFFIESLTTKGTKDKILNRGRMKEDFYFKHNKYKWMGTQQSMPQGNCHENYLHAQIQNWQNNKDLDKMMMKAVIGKCNFNLYRGQRIPVLILNIGNIARQKTTQQPEQSASEEVSYDKFLSGYYMISGIKYSWTYSDALFKQELLLTRREWSIPAQNSNP